MKNEDVLSFSVEESSKKVSMSVTKKSEVYLSLENRIEEIERNNRELHEKLMTIKQDIDALQADVKVLKGGLIRKIKSAVGRLCNWLKTIKNIYSWATFGVFLFSGIGGAILFWKEIKSIILKILV